MRAGLTLSVLLSLCASAAGAAESLVGSRYGVGQPGYPEMQWLEKWGADGTVSIKSRLCKGTTALDDISIGRWRVSGSKEIVAFINGFLSIEDTYDIVFEKDGTLRETLTATTRAEKDIGYVWRSKKVADDFKMPGCDPVS
jgi:hypothetical protein